MSYFPPFTLYSSLMSTCNVALKEWAVTCRALAQGRQVILLRKGGLLDAAIGENDGGTFTLEYSNFFLWPSHLHQNRRLVKPPHRDLFELAGKNSPRAEAQDEVAQVILPLWAHVERVWNLRESDEEKLMNAPHIWSRDYLDVRFGYKPEHPLLCAALRVYNLPQTYNLPMQAKFGGCRSWIELDENLSLDGAQPALDDAAWNKALGELQRVLD